MEVQQQVEMCSSQCLIAYKYDYATHFLVSLGIVSIIYLVYSATNV